MAIAQKQREPLLETDCLQALAEIEFHLGDHQQAIEHLQQAIVITEAIGNWRGEIQHYSLLSLIHADYGKISEAIDTQEQALDIATDIGDLQSRCQCMERLGKLMILQGDLQQAAPI